MENKYLVLNSSPFALNQILSYRELLFSVQRSPEKHTTNTSRCGSVIHRDCSVCTANARTSNTAAIWGDDPAKTEKSAFIYIGNLKCQRRTPNL